MTRITKINNMGQLWQKFGQYYQLTAKDVLYGRLCGRNGWQDVRFSEDLQEELIDAFTRVIGGRKSDVVKRKLNRHSETIRQHWYMDRLILCRNSAESPIYWMYCAGQDGQWEGNEFRRYIYSL